MLQYLFPSVKQGLGSPFQLMARWGPMRLYSSAVRDTVKPVDSRKTYLIDRYKHLMESNQIVLFAHRNNLMKQESFELRNLVSELDGQVTVLRNNLFQVYLRNSHRPDPAAKVRKGEQNWKHPLLPLFRGPTAAISFKEANPQNIAKLLKALERSKDKLFIVGAKVETETFDVAKLNEFKTLPTKPELQSQLVGLLNIMGAAGLVRTLESASKTLYLTLKSHEDNINPEKKIEEETPKDA
ncbi:HHR184Wp [Eremothecium sinecaudum]|uniref:HHR184Wp n=1 Tax=Eremothecium sinecaudum TaxID=45286 RepID=A0A109V159_9SACH|nr:HHR184Wp [Eremothecium sinecaudum]AMD22953.1 HHR184Wp [Eremothecium sinecaudum]